MANRHGRRGRLRQTQSSESGTQRPDPPATGRVLPFPTSTAIPSETLSAASFEAMLERLRPSGEQLASYQQQRRSLEAQGFVFPRPGEAFKELGGTHPPVDPGA